jgi:ornithine carbamoyltransferase
MTIEETCGTLNGVKVAFIGDGANNVATSLAIACAQLGVEIAIVAPPEHSARPELIEWLESESLGYFLTVSSDPADGV